MGKNSLWHSKKINMELFGKRDEFKNSGSTASLCIIRETDADMKAIFVNIGDSPMYHYTSNHKSLVPIYESHHPEADEKIRREPKWNLVKKTLDSFKETLEISTKDYANFIDDQKSTEFNKNT